jgi:hypothetical protein
MNPVKDLQEFITKVDKNIQANLDATNPHWHDLKFTFGNAMLRIPMNADTLERLTRFINEEIEEIVQLNTNNDEYRWLGAYQKRHTELTGAHKDWFIVFTHGNQYVINPFVDADGEECNPDKAYPKSFIMSDWMTQAQGIMTGIKRTMIEFINQTIKGEGETLASNTYYDFNWLLGTFLFHACWDLCENDFICKDPHEAMNIVTEAGFFHKACELLVRMYENGHESLRFYNAVDNTMRHGIRGVGTKYFVKLEVTNGY